MKKLQRILKARANSFENHVTINGQQERNGQQEQHQQQLAIMNQSGDNNDGDKTQTGIVSPPPQENKDHDQPLFCDDPAHNLVRQMVTGTNDGLEDDESVLMTDEKSVVTDIESLRDMIHTAFDLTETNTLAASTKASSVATVTTATTTSEIKRSLPLVPLPHGAHMTVGALTRLLLKSKKASWVSSLTGIA